MQDKRLDIPYCDERKHLIEQAELCVDEKMFDLFVYYINERYNIHLLKDIEGQSPPYTDDPVLQRYSFTNVRREHDRTTRWGIERIYHNKSLTYKDKLYYAVLLRLFNKPKTLEIANLPQSCIGSNHHRQVDFPTIYLTDYMQTHPAYKVFSKAYYISGMSGKLQSTYDYCTRRGEAVFEAVYQAFAHNRLYDNILKCRSALEVWRLLCNTVTGVGGFLAYQMFIDMTYIDKFPYSENHFTSAGVGCVRGLKHLFPDVKLTHTQTNKGLTFSEAVYWLRDNFDALLDKSGSERFMDNWYDLEPCDRYMNLMSMENCLCEFYKYVKLTAAYTTGKKIYGVRRKRYNESEVIIE